MKLWKILLCPVMAVLLLSACSQADTPNVPTAPNAPNMPHETVTEAQPVPLCPPAPVVQWALPQDDPTRMETRVVSNEVFFEETGTLWRTEYVYDQNDNLMENRTLTFDQDGRPGMVIIEKKDVEENAVYQKGVYYREDGTVDSADHMVFNSYGQEYLRWQYVCGEDGSVSEEYYDQYEYGENHKVCRKIFSKKLDGILRFTQQEDFDDAGKLTKRSCWYFYEDGSVKEWSSAMPEVSDPTLTRHTKITYTYHAGGQVKSETVESWLSVDEKKSEDGSPVYQWNYSYVIQYDENGNKIDP
jgi:hypothetical protein